MQQSTVEIAFPAEPETKVQTRVVGSLNRHARRDQANAAKQRVRALSKMAGSEEELQKLLSFITDETNTMIVGKTLMRLAYRAHKLGKINGQQARLFGCVGVK